MRHYKPFLDEMDILIAMTVKCIPKDVWNRSKEKSMDMWKDGKPKKWYYAIPIILIWLLIIWLIFKVVWL